MMVNILQAAVAVVTGGDQNFGPPGLGREKLFCLDPVAIHAGVFERWPAIDDPAAGPAAKIVLTVGMHFEAKYCLQYQLPQYK